ncbi:MAG: helicase, partial [Bacteroidetes bacterium QS_8_68_15]
MPGSSARSASSELPGIQPQDGFSFRDGQRAFLEKLAAAWKKGETNHLGVFVPGYGKTIAALSAFVVARAMGAAEKLVVFVPRGNLRDQYADPEELAQTFASLGARPPSFCVADSDEVFLKNLATEIVITTYQYASGAGGRRALREFCQQADSLFVFDEVHHLAVDGTWAQEISDLPYARSIGLSGTPLRSDGKTLFGVPHTEDENGVPYYDALHEVTMRDAHAEGGILKRVDAHVVDYDLQMIREDTGEEVNLSLSEMREIADEEDDLDAYFAR